MHSQTCFPSPKCHCLYFILMKTRQLKIRTHSFCYFYASNCNIQQRISLVMRRKDVIRAMIFISNLMRIWTSCCFFYFQLPDKQNNVVVLVQRFILFSKKNTRVPTDEQQYVGCSSNRGCSTNTAVQ